MECDFNTFLYGLCDYTIITQSVQKCVKITFHFLQCIFTAYKMEPALRAKLTALRSLIVESEAEQQTSPNQQVDAVKILKFFILSLGLTQSWLRS